VIVFNFSEKHKEGKRGEKEKEGERLRLREREMNEDKEYILKSSIGQIVFVCTPSLRNSPKFRLLCTKRNNIY
jgi:hypothetical protein